MRFLRHATFLAATLGTALAVRAADRTGPDPSEIIFPRASAAAPEATAGSSASALPAPSLNGSLPALGYVLLLLVMVGGVWFLLKRGSLPRPFQKGEGRLKVLETRVLGNRQFLVVVEYDDAKMLLGVCQGRIDYLTPLAGHPLAEAEAEAAAEADGTPEPRLTRIPAPATGARR